MKDLRDCRVLLVDGARANLDILVEGLRGEHQLSVARDGETALRIAARVPPDLVLLDILMPGIDGYEVCRRLRLMPETAEVPIMFDLRARRGGGQGARLRGWRQRLPHEALRDAGGPGPSTLAAQGQGLQRCGQGADRRRAACGPRDSDVQYVNGMGNVILDTLEVGGVPVSVLAAREDFEDSAERLAEILEAYAS